MSRTSRPNVPAIASRSGSGVPPTVKAVFDSPHAATGTAPTAPRASTARLRRRSGTKANQAMAPMASATSEPRDWVRSMARTRTPAAGKASARSSRPLERLAPIQSAGTMPMAAIDPTAFQ